MLVADGLVALLTDGSHLVSDGRCNTGESYGGDQGGGTTVGLSYIGEGLPIKVHELAGGGERIWGHAAPARVAIAVTTRTSVATSCLGVIKDRIQEETTPCTGSPGVNWSSGVCSAAASQTNASARELGAEA